MTKEKIYTGDCLNALSKVNKESVDLAYIDPPFFTQREHKSVTRDGSKHFSFRDIWDTRDEYTDFIYQRISRTCDVLKESGSIFFHCDKSASHIIRMILDSIFGADNFQAEIIWTFKRWSNSRKGLLPAHQTILFYSKSKNFKFNTSYQEYSPSTNIDQIMQKRSRDHRNKSVYAKNKDGEMISCGGKKGVPLSDVWNIPFLNPKAKERVGYPTQKPCLLMQQIIELVTDEGDMVLDPFCGSGTTLVTAKLLNRDSIGIDISEDAVSLTKSRLENPIVTESPLLKKGFDSYRQHDPRAIEHLVGTDYTPIHRNRGIDGLLKNQIDGLPVFVRVQRAGESIGQTVSYLKKATCNKGMCKLIIIATSLELIQHKLLDGVVIIPSTKYSIDEYRKYLSSSYKDTNKSVCNNMQMQ